MLSVLAGNQVHSLVARQALDGRPALKLLQDEYARRAAKWFARECALSRAGLEQRHLRWQCAVFFRQRISDVIVGDLAGRRPHCRIDLGCRRKATR